MKIALTILVLALIIGAAFIVWRRVAGRKYISLDELEPKEGEATHVNVSDLHPRDPLIGLVREIGQTQAAALDGATVTIHSVTEHDRFKDATPQPGKKLVAVDVTFSGFKYGFGLAGVELLDVEREEVQSYGGDAYQVYLNADGTLQPKQGEDYWSANDESDSVRLYLVYSVPNSARRIGLGYWGRVIVDRRYDVQPPKEPLASR